MYLPSGPACVQGDPGDPPLESWPFTPVFSVCASPSFPHLLLRFAALSRDVETAGGERAPRAFAATRPPTPPPPVPPPPPPSPRVPARSGCVCANTRGGGVGGACAGEGSPRESVFPGSLFKTFSAPLRLRMEEGREGRGEGRGELQRKPLAEELLRPLRSNSIVVDWTGSLELEGCLFLGFFSFSCFFFFTTFSLLFFFFPLREEESVARIFFADRDDSFNFRFRSLHRAE